MIVCLCNALEEQEIRKAVAEGARCYEDIIAEDCGCCRECIEEIIEEEIET